MVAARLSSPRSVAPASRAPVLAAVLSILVACGGSPGKGDRAARLESEPRLTPSPSGVSLGLELPAKAQAGEPVPITLRVTNESGRRTDLVTQGRPTAFDITVARRGGEVVWRRLEGAVISAVLQVRTLAPGEVRERSDTWSERSNVGKSVEPGEYLVTGALRTDPPTELRTQPVPLRILP